jgi:hypothetical protein
MGPVIDDLPALTASPGSAHHQGRFCKRGIGAAKAIVFGGGVRNADMAHKLAGTACLE